MEFSHIPEWTVLSFEELLEIPVSSLAYLGDAVYERYVRERLVRKFASQSGPLFKASLLYVEASGQASALDFITNHLKDDEENICRRARNNTPHSRPRHADPVAYRKATALEALCAWLWLQGKINRLEFLLEKAFIYLEEKQESTLEEIKTQHE